MPQRYAHKRVNGVLKLAHRAVMEAALGRELRPDEVVHHRNHQKRDNRLENLEVMPVGEHVRLHKKGQFRFTREFVLREIRRIAQQLGRRPGCKTDFEPLTGIGHATIDRMFGSWNRAVSEALAEEYQPRRQGTARTAPCQTRIDDAALLADYARVCRELGHRPSVVEYNRLGRWSHGPFYAHFGSWQSVPFIEVDP